MIPPLFSLRALFEKNLEPSISPESTLANLPKELLLEGRYLVENFDEQKYFHILDEIFNHTKNNLTTKNLAQYILNHV
jgi:hypothetical protein